VEINIYDSMVGEKVIPTVRIDGDEADTPEDIAKAYLKVKKLLKEENCQ